MSRLVLRLEESYRNWQRRDLAEEKILLSVSGCHLSEGAQRRESRMGLPHQRCTVHKLRNLIAKAPKHAHEAVREDYHRMVYAESLDLAYEARQAFLGNWKKPCPGVVASLEEAGENLLTFYQFPETQWVLMRTTKAIERFEVDARGRRRYGLHHKDRVQIGNSG